MVALPFCSVRDLLYQNDNSFFHYLTWYLLIFLGIDLKRIKSLLVMPDETGPEGWTCDCNVEMIDDRSIEFTIIQVNRKYEVKEIK